MKILTIGGKEYTLEYSFEAAGYKSCVEKIFKMVSGGYISQQGIMGDKTETKGQLAAAFVNGTAVMFGEMADTVVTAFYAGLLESNSVLNVQTAKNLLKQYFKENPDDKTATYPGMYELIKQCMEEDGFFRLTGLDDVIKNLGKAAEEAVETEAKIPPSGTKTPSKGKKLTSIK